MRQRVKTQGDKQRASTLLTVLVVMGMGILISTGLLQWASSTLSTRKVVEANARNFYVVESSINAVTAWLQNNSKNLVTAFNSANFGTNFDIGNPVAGDNMGATFQVPTLIKMKGTNNAVQISNNSYFGTSSFPNSTNIDTGAAFNPITAFQSADFGSGVSVRLLLIWALATDGHYEPVFRIDAINGGSGLDRGVHGINFVKSHLVNSGGGTGGYYANVGDFATQNSNNQCWSYQYTWSGAAWSRGAARSNCVITGQDDITLKSAIHGSVLTNKISGINLDGGSAAISGTKCQAPGCVTYTLPTVIEWDDRCDSVAERNVTVSSSPHSLTSGPTLAERCYKNIVVGSNKRVNFSTANHPYYIKSITLQNNSNSKLSFTTVGTGNKYQIYTDSFAGNQLNGNQYVATNLAPHQVEIYLTQDAAFTLNGTATMNGVFTGTSSTSFNILGNFSFYGAIRTNAISVTGNAVLGYDETLGGAPTLSDINFTLFKASQRYR